MKCPRDGSPLQKRRASGLQAEGCPCCGGILLELDRQTNLGFLKKELIPKLTEGHSGAEDPECKSPFTGLPMVQVEHKGIRIDYCRSSNSIWFDNGELQKIRSRPIRWNKQKSKTKSSNTILNGIDSGVSANVDGVIEILGELVAGLFDGI